MCNFLDSFSVICKYARKVEHCSEASDYSRKICFDNLTNIYANSKKCYNFLGWVVTTKTSVFRDPCFVHFLMMHPKITINEHIMETHDHNIYQNTTNTVLFPCTKHHTHNSIQITRTNTTTRDTTP